MKRSKQTTPSRWWCIWGGWHYSAAFARQAALILAIAPMASTVTATESDLLEPERAFMLSARFKDQNTVELQYKVADGYYLYRKRFKFEVLPTSSGKLGSAKFSKGKMKQDPTFGWVETYRNSVRILLPFTPSWKETAPAFSKQSWIKVTSQGCADAGVCYPPLQQLLTLQPGSLELVVQNRAGNDGTLTRQSPSTPLTRTPSLSDALRKQM